MKVHDGNVREVLSVLGPLQVTWQDHLGIFQARVCQAEIVNRGSLLSTYGTGGTASEALLNYWGLLVNLSGDEEIRVPFYNEANVKVNLQYRWTEGGFKVVRIK